MNDAFTFETEPFMQDRFGSSDLEEFEDEQFGFELEEEFRRRGRPFSRGTPPRRQPSRGIRFPGREPKRPWPLRPRRPIIGSRLRYTEPAPFVGSEYVRWVQHCLNRAMKLHLPVTGVMGPEARSAIRSFQRQRGLAVTGIAGPDTKEALKAACGGQRVATEDIGEEFEGTLGPVCARLEWLQTKRRTNLFSKREAMEQEGGGVYIAVKGRTLQKVGITPGSGFRGRLNVYPDDWKFYLAYIQSGSCGRSGITMVPVAVEYAIARTLYRADRSLPKHKLPRRLSKVLGDVDIENILPPGLVSLLPKAYQASGYKTGGTVTAYPPVTGVNLVLRQSQHPTWELS